MSDTSRGTFPPLQGLPDFVIALFPRLHAVGYSLAALLA